VTRWHKAGAQFEAKKDATKICFVVLMSVAEPEKPGGKRTVQFDYFCRAPS
jgi:hypothetical protein